MSEVSVLSTPRSPWGMISISFVAAGCAIFLLFWLYFLFRNRCLAFLACRQRRILTENDPEETLTEFRNVGLTAEAMKSLELIQYVEEEEVGRGDGSRGSSSSSPECAICLVDFGKGEWLRVLPNCAHSFHASCIDAWLGSRYDCPLCRKRVLAGVGDSRSGGSVATVPLEALPREGVNRLVPLAYRRVESGRDMQSLAWL